MTTLTGIYLILFFTCLQNLVQLLRPTRRARLPVKPLGVEAVDLHMYQQHLNHLGHWVGLAGEHVHLNPEVKGAWCILILSHARQGKGGTRAAHTVSTQKPSTFVDSSNRTVIFVVGLWRSVPTCLACLVEQSVMILLKHFLWQINLQALIKRFFKKRVQLMPLFKWVS